jgi:rhamnose utilization protein RhaD (predicted bifunctional aldolase and dehydrogenase)/NAD(P)-dependent dehydrogenase (short-subunit alcohol dehydrogenase family)
MKEVDSLIEISQMYGRDNRLVIAGGGNTSYKNKDKLWIKASGVSLATITEDGFAVLDRARLNIMTDKVYSTVAEEREEQVKKDLEEATLTKGKRPSVETSMHNIINHAFVVHLHPTLVNGLMCSKNAESELLKLFGEKVIFVEYTDPGYVLFKKVNDKIEEYRQRFGDEPKVIWLQNHGIFVAADSIEEIRSIYNDILEKLESSLVEPLNIEPLKVNTGVVELLPALRMILSKKELKTLRVRNNSLVQYFSEHTENQKNIVKPFTPDAIVYCKSNYIFLNSDENLLIEAEQKINTFTKEFGYLPKVLLIRGIGLVAIGDNAKQCDILLDVFEDAMSVAFLSKSFGGAHPMTDEQIRFIDTWEVENYRRSVAAGTSTGRAENKTIIITGAAQGFGEGIGECLVKEGANIVIADLNEIKGDQTAEAFNKISKSNQSVFVKTDVSDINNLEKLIYKSVCEFGGIDCFISNAGILRAGGLEDMTPENFDLVTKINYSAYFYCTKVVSKVMKLQTKYGSNDYYADMIQINSKSGLEGSKANFAYAGGKFGGIGLTQSFALELAPYRIKVNSVCPGNFYEGPLWSDPVNGLFVQYLKAGKVPGAKTVEEVKEFYLSKVPMRKGCTPLDVSKGILYLMEQKGETGQALPITGGQIMLK